MKKRLLLLVIIFVLFLFICCTRDENPHKAIEVEQEERKLRCCTCVRQDENFDFILQKMDIPNQERYIITESLKEYMDMKSCMPGDSIIVVKSYGGDFVKLEYIKSPFLRYYVKKIDSTYEANVVEIIPSFAVCTVNGTINGSLYESIVSMGESVELVFDYADIFAWVIDFLTEVQNGDRFEIMFENKYIDNRCVENGKIIAASYRGEIGDYFAFYFKDPDGREDYYDEEGNSLRKQLLKTPLQYRRISSYFSLRRFHPVLKYYRPHYGIDFAAPIGTPVSSVGDGHVIFAGWKGGYGNLVIISHPNSYKTYYAHLSKIKKGIVSGAKVKQGQVIGNVGSTGLSTGPHLDFRIKKYGKWVNPLKIDLPPAEPINEKYRELYMEEMNAIREAVFEKRKMGEMEKRGKE